MTVETQTREKTRVFITGNCEGLSELSDALGRHSELELVGKSEHVREGAGALTGGHLQAVLHATRSSALPVEEIAAIVKAMQDFRSGSRAATVMDRIAKGFTDEEVQAIAAWYATQ